MTNYGRPGSFKVDQSSKLISGAWIGVLVNAKIKIRTDRTGAGCHIRINKRR